MGIGYIYSIHKGLFNVCYGLIERRGRFRAEVVVIRRIISQVLAQDSLFVISQTDRNRLGTGRQVL